MCIIHIVIIKVNSQNYIFLIADFIKDPCKSEIIHFFNIYKVSDLQGSLLFKKTPSSSPEPQGQERVKDNDGRSF